MESGFFMESSTRELEPHLIYCKQVCGAQRRQPTQGMPAFSRPVSPLPPGVLDPLHLLCSSPRGGSCHLPLLAGCSSAVSSPAAPHLRFLSFVSEGCTCVADLQKTWRHSCGEEKENLKFESGLAFKNVSRINKHFSAYRKPESPAKLTSRLAHVHQS